MIYYLHDCIATTFPLKPYSIIPHGELFRCIKLSVTWQSSLLVA